MFTNINENPMLSEEMQKLIRDHSAGMVATINEDGTPAVSPKATFVVLDNKRLAFGNIRSPGTIVNLSKRPQVEICFIDVVLRKAVRVSGSARVILRHDADDSLNEAFAAHWAPYLDMMSSFVEIDISAAEMILSPAYDIGLSEEALKETNLKKLNAL